MKRLKCILTYDGSSYYGWQDNQSQQSIEKIFKQSLLLLFPSIHSLEAASRTDRGVHALGQVACFNTLELRYSLPEIRFRLNRVLPPSIRVTTIEIVSLAFHPSLDCTAKTYLYQIYNDVFIPPFKRHYFWHIPQKIDFSRMKKAANHLIGYRDFSTLINRSKDFSQSKCRIDSILIENTSQHEIDIEVTGKSFFYKMVRNIIGILIEIGKNPHFSTEIEQILEAKDRREAAMCAPAHGLFLKQILYKTREEEVND